MQYLSLSLSRTAISPCLRVHLKTGHPESFNILRQTLLKMLTTFLDFADSFLKFIFQVHSLFGNIDPACILQGSVWLILDNSFYIVDLSQSVMYFNEGYCLKFSSLFHKQIAPNFIAYYLPTLCVFFYRDSHIAQVILSCLFCTQKHEVAYWS